jgi:hypothetical protein
VYAAYIYLIYSELYEITYEFDITWTEMFQISVVSR